MSANRLWNQRLILAGTETTYNDSTALTGANAMLCDKSSDIQMFSADVIRRNNIKGYLGSNPAINVKKKVMIKLKVELTCSGAAGTPPPWAPLLKMCGFTETISEGVKVTYTPLSENFASGVIYHWIGPVRQIVRGIRGNVSFEMNVNQLPYMMIDAIGLYADPTDTAQATGDFSDFQDPQPSNRFYTSDMELIGWQDPRIIDLTLDAGHQVVFDDDHVGEEIMIVDREAKGSITFKGTPLATFDPYSTASETTTGAFSFQHGIGAGNIVRFSSPVAALGNPQSADRNGIWTIKSDLSFSPTAANNEFVIEVM